MKLSPVIFLLVLPLSTIAQEGVTLPSPEIICPAKADFGQMVIVGAKIDRSKWPANAQQIKYKWVVYENGEQKRDVVVWPDGSQLFFAAGMRPTKITVTLYIGCVLANEKTLKDGSETIKAYTNLELNLQEPVSKTIIVGDGSNPNPPPPAPDVNFPDGKYKLSNFIYKTVRMSGLSQQEQVTIANALAVNFENISTRMFNGEAGFTDIEAVLLATAALNKTALQQSGVAINKLEGIKKTLGDKIYELNISTIADLSVAWKELAVGLRGVK